MDRVGPSRDGLLRGRILRLAKTTIKPNFDLDGGTFEKVPKSQKSIRFGEPRSHAPSQNDDEPCVYKQQVECKLDASHEIRPDKAVALCRIQSKTRLELMHQRTEVFS